MVGAQSACVRNGFQRREKAFHWEVWKGPKEVCPLRWTLKDQVLIEDWAFRGRGSPLSKGVELRSLLVTVNSGYPG